MKILWISGGNRGPCTLHFILVFVWLPISCAVAQTAGPRGWIAALIEENGNSASSWQPSGAHGESQRAFLPAHTVTFLVGILAGYAIACLERSLIRRLRSSSRTEHVEAKTVDPSAGETASVKVHTAAGPPANRVQPNEEELTNENTERCAELMAPHNDTCASTTTTDEIGSRAVLPCVVEDQGQPSQVGTSVQQEFTLVTGSPTAWGTGQEDTAVVSRLVAAMEFLLEILGITQHDFEKLPLNDKLKLLEVAYRHNEIGNQQERNNITAGEADSKAKKEAMDQVIKLNDAFQDMLSITITLGSLMMLVLCGVGQWHSRHLSESLARKLWLACSAGPAKQFAWHDVFGPFLHQAKIAWCYSRGIGNAFIALMALLGCTWALFRFEVLNQYKAIKVLWMSLVLGFLCGWLGYVVVSSLGGNALVWVVMWEVWCLSHAGLSVFSTTQTANRTTKLIWIYSSWWTQILLVGMLAIALPVTMSVLPFVDWFLILPEALWLA